VQAPDVLGFSCALLPADHLRLFSLGRSGKDHRGVDLISDALPFGRLWYGEPNAISNAVDYARFRSRSHRAVIRVYDATGNAIETHEARGRFPSRCDRQQAKKSYLTAPCPSNSRHEDPCQVLGGKGQRNRPRTWSAWLAAHLNSRAC